MTLELETKPGPNRRLEWVSLVYLLLFVLAVMAPSLVTHGYFGFRQESVEEFLIFLFGLAGLATFVGYNRIMEMRLRERDTAVVDAERAKKELIESYRYIGQVNRQIEMLKSLSNQTSMTLLDADSYRKDLLQSIVSNAAAVVGSRSALLRFVDIQKLRTESETHFSVGKENALKIANKELRSLHESQSPYAFIKTEDGMNSLVVGSDRRISDVRAFLIFTIEDSQMMDVEASLLKVFVNQAELVFYNLQHRRDTGLTSPLQMINAVTAKKSGEIS